MARIVPNMSNNHVNKTPKWMNGSLIADAGNRIFNAAKNLVKTASKGRDITLQYTCNECSRLWSRDHASFVKQRVASLREGQKEAKLLCPNCQAEVAPYKTMEARANTTVDEQPLMAKEAGGTYNTFVDRHMQYKAINELSMYASKKGMYGAVARYIKADHEKLAGADYPTLNNFECVLEWNYGRKQKARVTATISIDSAGKYVYPSTFKTASGKELPFEKDYVRQVETSLMREPAMPTKRKTDTPEFKKTDPSNFRAASVEKKMTVKEYLQSEKK